MKIKITMSSDYCGTQDSTVELNYDGTEREFSCDHKISTEILNMLCDGDFAPYYLDIETEEDE